MVSYRWSAGGAGECTTILLTGEGGGRGLIQSHCSGWNHGARRALSRGPLFTLRTMITQPGREMQANREKERQKERMCALTLPSPHTHAHTHSSSVQHGGDGSVSPFVISHQAERTIIPRGTPACLPAQLAYFGAAISRKNCDTGIMMYLIGPQ